MASGSISLHDHKLGETERRDNWWAEPLAIAVALGTFIIYATIRGLANSSYEYGHGTNVAPDHAYFLSPFYSPLLALPSWMPAWVGPALFVMWMPAGFRLTCYYARKVYYRSLFADPPACAVAEYCKQNYQGERGVWSFQNYHRFFLYLALGLVCMHIYHVTEACRWPVAGGGMTFGVSVGTLVLAVDLAFLSLYVFSCHSMRHLVGGGLDCFTGGAGETRYKLWSGVTKLNDHHGKFFWLSLFTVGFADFYIWLVSSGRINDLRIL